MNMDIMNINGMRRKSKRNLTRPPLYKIYQSISEADFSPCSLLCLFLYLLYRLSLKLNLPLFSYSIFILDAYYHYFVAEYKEHTHMSNNLFWVWVRRRGWTLFTFYYNRRCDFIGRGSQKGIKIVEIRERNFDDQTSFDKTSRTHLEMTKDIYCMSMRHETWESIKIYFDVSDSPSTFVFCSAWLCYFTYFDCFWSIKFRGYFQELRSLINFIFKPKLFLNFTKKKKSFWSFLIFLI